MLEVDSLPWGGAQRIIIDPMDVSISANESPQPEQPKVGDASRFKTRFPCSDARRRELFDLYQTAKKQKLEELRQWYSCKKG